MLYSVISGFVSGALAHWVYDQYNLAIWEAVLIWLLGGVNFALGWIGGRFSK